MSESESSMEPPVLELDGVHVGYRTGGRWTDVVRDVSFKIEAGQTVGVVGESGCGKSTLAFSIMNYLGSNGRVSAGSVRFKGRDLASLSGREARAIRGSKIAMVYQNPMSALNPSIRIGRQIAESVRTHQSVSKSEAEDQARAILDKVHMPAPGSVMARYPHELSGGMQQRVVIAMALINNPDLLIMDEPTTGLDVTTEAAVLDLVNELKADFDAAILYISHNLGVVAEVCDLVNVMYAGQVVEHGTVDEIFDRPSHPYARDLLECVPRLDWHYRDQPLRTIEGRVPLPTQLPAGCVYAPRCRFAEDSCEHERPELLSIGRADSPDADADADGDGEERKVRCLFVDKVAATAEETTEARTTTVEPTDRTLLDLAELRNYYPTRAGTVKAVDGIDFEIKAGETFSLVGESGCGKSTLGRCVVGLLTPTSGSITYDGTDATADAARRSDELRKALQIVFQNPEATLNPKHRVGRILGRTLQFFGDTDSDARRSKVEGLLEAVRLDGSYADRFPAQLSGGEKQRVAIARAFAGDPDLVVCDEAVSALDVSVQASILNLLVDLKEERHCAYLFISHDLAVVRYISDRIGVMYLGRLMEIGTADQIFAGPSHPYTEALLSAVQSPSQSGGDEVEPVRLEGSVPSPIDPPAGCPFHSRCPRKLGPQCENDTPPWQDGGDGHGIFCHIPLDELEREQAVVITSAAGDF